MTNFEYYKETILEIMNQGYSCHCAFSVVDNKPNLCSERFCKNCDFYKTGCSPRAAVRWLYEEHKEQLKLTKKERQFCELVETGWIARDADERLYYFKEEPARDKQRKVWDEVPFSKIIEINQFDNCNFSFITWEDEEPWSIEDLLKLEVEE